VFYRDQFGGEIPFGGRGLLGSRGEIFLRRRQEKAIASAGPAGWCVPTQAQVRSESVGADYDKLALMPPPPNLFVACDAIGRLTVFSP
jgi:hypothetical protein